MANLRILETHLLSNYSDIMEARDRNENIGVLMDDEPEPEWVRYSFNLYRVESCLDTETNDMSIEGTKVYFEDGSAAIIAMKYDKFLSHWKSCMYIQN